MKKYKLGFDAWGLLLFLVIMIPNFIWFVVPAPNDILRTESVTPIVDSIGSIFQILFVSILCMLKRKDLERLKISKLIIMTIVAVGLYYVGWVAYYIGITNPVIIILLTIPPCASFGLYAIDRKNVLALIPIIVFTFCHIVYGVGNYII